MITDTIPKFNTTFPTITPEAAINSALILDFSIVEVKLPIFS